MLSRLNYMTLRRSSRMQNSKPTLITQVYPWAIFSYCSIAEKVIRYAYIALPHPTTLAPAVLLYSN
jgi:hypothetical protein